jgi:uncharacterized protein YgiM (DUF1202 family)
MKRIQLVVVATIFVAMTACSSYPTTPNETVKTVEPTATVISQPTPDAVVNIGTVNVRSGPGTAYPVQAYAVRGDKLIILGQAYNCGWLKVETPNGQTVWVRETYVTHSLACGEIAQA